MTPRKGRCILVVDDDESGRYAVARVLRQAGFDTSEAATGAEALRRLASDYCDLVLLDTRLPDISGTEVCRRIKSSAEYARPLVLQMSASAVDETARVTALEGGADGYITSPIEPPVLVATVRSLLRIRAAEQALHEATVEWRATFDAIRDGVAVLDGQGAVQRSNNAFQSSVGLENKDIDGRTLDDLMPPSLGEPLLSQPLDANHRAYAERTLGERSFNITVDPIADSHGGVAIVKDVTDRKQLEEQLRHSQKLESIGLLAGGVAHDFNNLLMGILGNASLALESLQDPAVLRGLLRDVVRASERAAELTQQLLAYAGKGRFVVGPANLSVLIQDLVPLLRTSIPRKVRLELDLDQDLPPIQVDKTQIEQVVMNLIINAGESIQGDGSVIVKTSAGRFVPEDLADFQTEHKEGGNYAVLQVRDTGSGMDVETLKKIFDPFFSTKFLGRGLGLSAALGIVRGHRGAIKVISEPGRGTIFEVLLPLSASVNLRRHDQKPVLTRERDTILVVDDERIVRNVLQKALENAGYEVLLSENGADALKVVSREGSRISLVVLDLVMPVMSGEEALPQLLALNPTLLVIVSSGQHEAECMEKVGDRPVAGFLQKPYLPTALIKKVRSVLGSKVKECPELLPSD